MEEVTDLVFLADSSSTTSFFLSASELVKETVGVLETKEAGFLAEDRLPCSLDHCHHMAERNNDTVS